jgi:glucose/mannose-6-phosphate isomerase
VILSSYSGNTEEVISCLHDAQTKGAQIFGITTGGKLAQLLEKDSLPRYVFDPKNNPSKQPRMSIGYAAGAILSLLSQTQTIHLWGEEIDSAFKTMRAAIKDYDENVAADKNLAKSYAGKLARRAPILVASEHLAGTAHTIKNHFNENAKTFSALFELPELNHHLMEGLKYPAKLREVFHFIFFNSKLYSERVQKRYPLTFEVIEKNGYEYSVFTPRSDKKVDQVFETLVFGSFVVYYLAKNYKIDPTIIPWVDYFKEKLAKG